MQPIKETDLSNCDKEPIHIPGMIQPFGALLVVERATWRIVQASDNLPGMLGMRLDEALGAPLDAVIGAEVTRQLQTVLEKGELHSVSPARIRLPGNGRLYHLLYHVSNQHLLAEFEPIDIDPQAGITPLQGDLPFREIDECDSHEALCALMVREVRRLTGYDRVIAYRFDEDWHGVVIAEEDNGRYAESFLGHHFPASDIPVPARKLFTLNRLRIIPDIHYQPAALVPPRTPGDEQPLDMTYCLLRSVSPIHLEYLANMDVRASLTISLMHGERLWGMVTCHHATPYKPEPAARLRCKVLAELASYAISDIDRRRTTAIADQRRQELARIRDWLASHDRILDGMEAIASQVLTALDSDTVAISLQGHLIELGTPLPQEALERIRAAMARDESAEIVHTRHLAGLDASLSAVAPLASGALYTRLDKHGYLLALRREIVESRIWAGNPNKPVDYDPKARLHPRKSFAQWQEQVRGHTRRWRPLDLEAAMEFSRLILERHEQLARQRFESALRIERDRSRAILETMTEGFMLLAYDLRILQINPEGLRLLPETSAGVLGLPLWQVWPGIEHGPLGEFFRRAVTLRIPASMEHVQERDGAPAWLDVRVYWSGDGLAVFFRDVTERKRAEQALRRLNDTLEERVAERTAELAHAHEQLHQSQKMEALGQLTGGIAHDFNNLLAGIVSSLDLMRIRLAQGRPDHLSRYIETAGASAEKAAALTHRLLAFSRRQTLAPKPTDVNRLASSLQDLIQRTVGPGIEVRTELAPDLWLTLCDPNQLENALLNLAINSRDAMPGGGLLRIVSANVAVPRGRGKRRAAAGQEHDADLAPGDYVMLAVADSGSGMPPEVARRAFEPFYTTKPSGKGTGLGLAMIYSFVTQSGGQARIHSAPGAGTEVRLYLPRHAGQDAAVLGAGTAAAPLASMRRAQVLIVDDEPDLRLLLSELVTELGHDALHAHDAASAMRCLRGRHRFDLLITDIGLPGGVSGAELAAQARALLPELKIIFITGYGDKTPLLDGRLDQQASVITKPFSVDDLARQITAILDVGVGR
ncbi:PAS domain S-box-containing protein [Noviherbaspirillum humi]|uniref:histidine kinase n=1 Tax=Noviherbaspirillum humi TaxID=1688639 RepID=A0A239L5S0_9BURK|nr:ATP-binding protein [Noviherbaspirillum humi]SNT25650.1 PAS domain S-box-containing protein [Noviherbaspirillum humi]